MLFDRIHVISTLILVSIVLTFGCTDSDTESVQSTTPVVTSAPAITASPHWWDNDPDFDSGVIEADNNLFGVEVSGVIRESSAGQNYEVFNDLQRVIFVHQEFDIQDLDQVDYRLIDRYGTPQLIIIEKLDSSGDGLLDLVAVQYMGTKGGWIEEFNYFNSANINNYLQAYLDPESHPVLIRS